MEIQSGFYVQNNNPLDCTTNLFSNMKTVVVLMQIVLLFACKYHYYYCAHEQ